MQLTKENIEKYTLCIVDGDRRFLAVAPRWSVDEGDKVFVEGEGVCTAVNTLHIYGHEFDKFEFITNLYGSADIQQIDYVLQKLWYKEEKDEE